MPSSMAGAMSRATRTATSLWLEVAGIGLYICQKEAASIQIVAAYNAAGQFMTEPPCVRRPVQDILFQRGKFRKRHSAVSDAGNTPDFGRPERNGTGPVAV